MINPALPITSSTKFPYLRWVTYFYTEHIKKEPIVALFNFYIIIDLVMVMVMVTAGEILHFNKALIEWAGLVGGLQL